jgi:NAD(P)-dependent dehydrogenase (short-subunit alcohol dehydrogenase family)
LAVQTDVTAPDSVRGAVDATLEKFGRIDCLINNAAIFVTPGPPALLGGRP